MSENRRRQPEPESRPASPDPSSSPASATEPADHSRRGFLGTASSLAMGAGLLAGYGAFAAVAGRFVYPTRGRGSAWMFVTELERMKPGDSLVYRTPGGETVAVARQDRVGTADDFIALSSTCPHLGCQVKWEAQNDRFFCPCHNGVFDPTGKGVGGPPGDAGQSLLRYPLKVEKGLLFIQVSLEQVASRGDGREAGIVAQTETPEGPGHDPCLAQRAAPSRHQNHRSENGPARGTA